MSYCKESETQNVRPRTARDRVAELSGSGKINPTPVMKPRQDSGTGVELYLTKERLATTLRHGTEDFSQVTLLEVSINTQEKSVGDLGAYFPKLVQLRMTDSFIVSVRDLGTSFSHLQVLYMFRCGLQELDGISILSSLRELYLAYNNVSDLSQIGMLENLCLLDLEGNDVDDLVQVQYLGLCSKLQTLTLEGNPVCVCPNLSVTQPTGYNYRIAVRNLVPQLRYLDEIRVEDDRLGSSSTMGVEWAILRNAIRDSSRAVEDEETVEIACSRPTSARRPASRHGPLCSRRSRPQTGSRPMSASRPEVLYPPDETAAAAETDTSILTHGAGKILFCGNPSYAIRARREKSQKAPVGFNLTQCNPPFLVPKHTYDLEDPDVRTHGDVFAELRDWREQHSRRLQAVERERLLMQKEHTPKLTP